MTADLFERAVAQINPLLDEARVRAPSAEAELAARIVGYAFMLLIAELGTGAAKAVVQAMVDIGISKRRKPKLEIVR